MSEELLEKCSSKNKRRVTFQGEHNTYRYSKRDFLITAFNFLLDQFGAPHTTPDLNDDDIVSSQH